jgi:hypothetical protein
VEGGCLEIELDEVAVELSGLLTARDVPKYPS